MQELIERILANCGDLSQIETNELEQVVTKWQQCLCNGTMMDTNLMLAADIASAELNRRV